MLSSAMRDHRTLSLDPSEITVFKLLDADGRPCLIRYSGTAAGQRFDLDPGNLVMGRGEEADLKVDGHGISRRHAALQVGPQGVVLMDLGSANCTYVNDQRVLDPVVLRDGDLVRLANVVFRFHDRRSLDALLHQRLHRLASEDPLTGVSNRRHAHEALQRELARARRSGLPLSLLCCDLDHFKSVNDTHGHAAGDTVLKDSAALMKAELRADDVLGRWGGEEFVVIAGNTDFEHALVLAERLRQVVAAHAFELEVAEHGRLRQVLHRQTMSIGLAVLKDEMRDEHDLLAAADRRMYAAKREGRNRVVAVDPPPAR
jgi:two-component system, cell cycle response regulator